MKKIIAVFDVTDAPWYVLGFGCRIAKKHNAVIHGVFLEEPTGDTELNYAFPNDLTLTKEEGTDELIDQENQSLIQDNIRLFKDECDTAGIQHTIDSNFKLKQVVEESSNADLIIADTRAEFKYELLKQVKIPVCLVSEKDLPQQVLLMYDGSDSAKYAVDAFASLFPDLTQLPTDLISVNHPQEELRSDVEELKNRFPNLKEVYINGKLEKELINYLETHSTHLMIVKGSFGRSAVSEFFKRSLSRIILENSRVSVFTAHR